MNLLTHFEADVLAHTSSNGRYVTGEARVIAMASAGLLFDHGPQALAGGEHYMVMTVSGREALSAWRAAQPKPLKLKRRRQSPMFEAWRTYCENCQRIPFPEFLKEVWPHRREWA